MVYGSIIIVVIFQKYVDSVQNVRDIGIAEFAQSHKMRENIPDTIADFHIVNENVIQGISELCDLDIAAIRNTVNNIVANNIENVFGDFCRFLDM